MHTVSSQLVSIVTYLPPPSFSATSNIESATQPPLLFRPPRGIYTSGCKLLTSPLSACNAKTLRSLLLIDFVSLCHSLFVHPCPTRRITIHCVITVASNVYWWFDKKKGLWCHFLSIEPMPNATYRPPAWWSYSHALDGKSSSACSKSPAAVMWYALK